MDKRIVIRDQILSLQSELSLAERMLDSEKIDDSLRKRVRTRLRNMIKPLQIELGLLQHEINNGQSLDKSWERFRNIYKECTPIFRECLAFLEGALARNIHLDNGLCRIADAMLDDLSDRAGIPWGRFTILAEREFYGDMAEIIRLRFPEVSIWNLPVASHEFGHFVVQQLEVVRVDGRFKHYLQRYEEIFKRWGRTQPLILHEYYADLFAVYALGPAYACTCLILRFDPGRAHYDDEQHPSLVKRAHVILKGLEVMDNFEGVLGPYYSIRQHLRTVWQDSLAETGQTEPLDQALTMLLDKLVEELLVRLRMKMPDVQYNAWSRASGLAEELIKNPAQAVLSPDHTLPDVLNAAWIWRLQQHDNASLSQVSERVWVLCQEITHRSAGTGH